MKLNKNAVLTIIEEYFWDELSSYIADCAISIEDDELDGIFESMVDYADLDEIYGLSVSNIELEEDGDTITVMGELHADLSLNGYVYYDGENICIGSAEHFMGFTFTFEIYDGEYGEFWMEYLY